MNVYLPLVAEVFEDSEVILLSVVCAHVKL